MNINWKWPDDGKNGKYPWYIIMWHLFWYPWIILCLSLATMFVFFCYGPKDACRFWSNSMNL